MQTKEDMKKKITEEEPMKALVVLLWHGTASELGKGGVCGAVQRVSKGQHLNPVCQQVHILHSISYLSYSDRLKWELFPMKNDHKSFPFHDFNLAFLGIWILSSASR